MFALYPGGIDIFLMMCIFGGGIASIISILIIICKEIKRKWIG